MGSHFVEDEGHCMAPYVLDLKGVPVSPERRKCVDGILAESFFNEFGLQLTRTFPPIRVTNVESSSHLESQAMSSMVSTAGEESGAM